MNNIDWLHGKKYTVATAPAASAHQNEVILVTNGAAGAAVLAISDGTNWKRMDVVATNISAS